VASGPWTKLSDVPAEPSARVVEVVDDAISGAGMRYYRVVNPAQP
jgi:hypothetical protein